MTMTSMERHAPELQLKALDTLWIQVTGTLCNLSCSHCFISCSPNNDTHQFMTAQQVLDAVLQGKKNGVKEFYFTGGEPFLHPDIKQLIELTLAEGPLTVLTNGTLLTEKTAAWLKQMQETHAHPLELRISLDGYTKEENDPIRGEGTFDRILKSVLRLVNHGINPIITITEVKPLMSCPTLQSDFKQKLADMGITNPRLKFLSPLQIGREAERTRGYHDEERLYADDVCSQKLDVLQCSNCRSVTSQGVFPCPILINHSDARMGNRLEDGMMAISLHHQACYTCYHQGLSCSNS